MPSNLERYRGGNNGDDDQFRSNPDVHEGRRWGGRHDMMNDPRGDMRGAFDDDARGGTRGNQSYGQQQFRGVGQGGQEDRGSYGGGWRGGYGGGQSGAGAGFDRGQSARGVGAYGNEGVDAMAGWNQGQYGGSGAEYGRYSGMQNQGQQAQERYGFGGSQPSNPQYVGMSPQHGGMGMGQPYGGMGMGQSYGGMGQGGQQPYGQRWGGGMSQSDQQPYGQRWGGGMSQGGQQPYGGGFGQSQRGKGPVGYQRADERIREDVCDRLTDDPEIDASGIEVTVKGCEVTLAGTVPDKRSKRMAEDCAERVQGVKDVQNQLRVQARDESDSMRSSSTSGMSSKRSKDGGLQS
jgi:hypothetical protein